MTPNSWEKGKREEEELQTKNIFFHQGFNNFIFINIDNDNIRYDKYNLKY